MRRAIVRDAIEERGARGHPVFDHFVQSGAELATRQRTEDSGIDQDRGRLIERTDEILPNRMVDADLPADRAVDLREQRRRHVRERYAAQVRRGGEARHVANHAAAERDDGRRPIGVRADERVVNARDGRHLLVAFAVGHEDRLRRRLAAERASELRAVQPPYERARDDEAPRRRAQRVERGGDAIDRAVGNEYRVRARWRGDVESNGLHEDAR